MGKANVEFCVVRFEQGTPSQWVVEAMNSDGDGAVDTAIFVGPLAQESAFEYANMRFTVSEK